MASVPPKKLGMLVYTVLLIMYTINVYYTVCILYEIHFIVKIKYCIPQCNACSLFITLVYYNFLVICFKDKMCFFMHIDLLNSNLTNKKIIFSCFQNNRCKILIFQPLCTIFRPYLTEMVHTAFLCIFGI